MQAQLVQHRMGLNLHRLGARIVILVNPVAKTHQAYALTLVLHLLHIIGNLVHGADLFQHFQRRFIGAAMRRAPQTGAAGGDAGKWIGAG